MGYKWKSRGSQSSHHYSDSCSIGFEFPPYRLCNWWIQQHKWGNFSGKSRTANFQDLGTSSPNIGRCLRSFDWVHCRTGNSWSSVNSSSSSGCRGYSYCSENLGRSLSDRCRQLRSLCSGRYRWDSCSDPRSRLNSLSCKECRSGWSSPSRNSRRTSNY